MRRPDQHIARSRRIAAGLALLLVAGLGASAPVPTNAVARPNKKIRGEAGANFKAKGRGMIRLAYKAFDPLKSGEPKITKNLRQITKDGLASWYLVQLEYPIRKRARDAVLKAGTQFGGFIPEGTYVMEMTPEQAARARKIAGVRWVGLYQPAYKLRPRYAGSPGVLDVAGSRDYRAWLFGGQDMAWTMARMSGIRGVTVDRAHSTSRVILFRATRDQLPSVARIHAVKWVTETPKVVLHNYNARWASDTGERDSFFVTAPGHLTGAGQTAADIDTGINYVLDSGGNAQRAFADFDANGQTKVADYVQTIPGNSPEAMFARTYNLTHHRKIAAYYDLAGDGYEPSEASNHGTHTGGSIAADYPDAAGLYGTYGGRFDGADGIAPGAHLVYQDVAQGPDGGLGGLPGDWYDAYEQAYDANPTELAETADPTHEFGPTLHARKVHSYDPLIDARTHNASIGSVVPLASIGEAESADSFVWDHEDMVIVNSASNDGPDIFTLSGYVGIGKNVLSSCASAGGRQPMVSLDSAAIFSSHGPTADLRLKPDVCTPGQIIVSTKGGTSDNDQYLQGTSMSSPVLTGLATLVRQYFYDGFGATPKGKSYEGYAVGTRNLSRRWNPSAALVKAIVINSAERMRGRYTGDKGDLEQLDGQWPSAGQGWGRVELDNALAFDKEARRLFVADVWNDSGGALDFSAKDYTIQVAAGEPLSVTLTWTDFPSGFAAGTTPLVDNLDLTVTGPDGTTYVGNNFTTQSGLVFNSLPGDPTLDIGETRAGTALPDIKNSVEGVRIEAPKAGTYTIHVDGGSDATNFIGTAGNKQGYALVASGLVGAGAKAASAVVETTKPIISNVNVESIASDLAMVTWHTDEPTTGAVILTDAAGKTSRFDDVYNPSSFPGLETPQNENKGRYVDKKVASTSHEVRLTGLAPGGKYSVTVESTDRAATPNTSTSGPTSFTSSAALFQPMANDTAMLLDRDASNGTPLTGMDQNWGEATQLYVGNFQTTPSSPPVIGPTGIPPARAVPAFMFRMPASVDPAHITGAHVELTGAHDITNHYTDDLHFTLSMLSSGVEDTWGPGTDYNTVVDAPVDAIAAPITGYRHGGGTKYTFAFSCGDLKALKDNLKEDGYSDGRRMAFRLESDSKELESLFSFEMGYGRRSRGPEYRPRLVLEYDGVDPLPCKDTPAPTISNVAVQSVPGDKPTAVAVSWRTDVPSSSVVLFRPAGTTAWRQVAVADRATDHLVMVEGLQPYGKYEFAVRSRTCNGLETTDDNHNKSYALFSEPYAPPRIDQVYTTLDASSGTATIRWITDVDGTSVVEYGTSPTALSSKAEAKDDQGNVAGPTRNHEVKLENLKGCTTYYFRPVSANGLGLRGVGTITSFNTPSDRLKDLGPTATFDTGMDGYTVKDLSSFAVPTTWANIGGAMRTAIAGVVPGYLSNTQTRLISPPFTTAGGLLEVSFTETMHSEGGFDFGTVEYSTNGGKTWIPVRAISGIGGAVADTFNGLPAPVPELVETLDLVHPGNGSTLPRDVKVSIQGVPAGKVQIGFRMSSDTNTEVQPGWSVDNVLLREVLPCKGLARATAASVRPKRSRSFIPLPLTGPIPARAATANADVDAVVTNIIPTDPGSLAAGNAVCVRVLGTKIRRVFPGTIGGGKKPPLPATGVGNGGPMALVALFGAAALGLWLRRRPA